MSTRNPNVVCVRLLLGTYPWRLFGQTGDGRYAFIPVPVCPEVGAELIEALLARIPQRGGWAS